ncbi:3'-5' exonuclease [Streptomyces sp. NA04227]|uniref:exonuclease domain-containing protein n=1 Tax=Streptomyces sp. NA04227 TaxID=2742136 RepID=UPI00158FBB9D|nr:exonuclease domain-containing protein [Streptomyces sp. NA04227]QKW09928.1 3'-5' exonuclease [Streptomyces sp. NA04227]
MAWHRELVYGFDLETTGTDPQQARIVTGAVVELRAGQTLGSREWLADPGIPIPAEAAAVHGITDELAAQGSPSDQVADAIAEVLTGAWRAGIPVVAYNATFDLTLLSAELRRHALPSLSERLGHDPAPVVDPYTIDRFVDRYRRGKRNLEAVCAEYGIALKSAHTAGADALAAARLACAVAERHPKIAGLTPAELHRQQIIWHAELAENFQRFLRRQGETDAFVDPVWPLREVAGETETV